MSSETEVDSDSAVHTHWRRQLVLTALACALVLAAGGLVGAAAAFTGVPSSALRMNGGRVVIGHPAHELSRFILWPALAAITAGIALLAAAIVHSVRVASFTFRREG